MILTDLGLDPQTIALCISVFSAGFLCTQFLSHVLTLDSLLTFLLVVWVFIYPRDWLFPLVQDTRVDEFHEYLLILLMFPVLVPALVWFLSTDPTDVTIRTALAVARLVSFGLAAIHSVLTQLIEGTFTSVGFAYLFYPQATMFIVYSVHLFYNSRINAQVRYGNLNSNLHFDLMQEAVYGTLCIIFPYRLASVFDRDLNWLHIFLYRQFGCMYLGLIAMTWIAPRFRSVANKRALLFSRAVTMLITLLMTLNKYYSGYIPETTHSKIMVAGFVCMTLPSVIGSMRRDQGGGWDLPWRGLRVPDVHMGAASPSDFYQVPRMIKQELIKRRNCSPKKKRSRKK